MLNENCYENLIGLVTPFDFPSQEGRFSMMASEVCRAKQVACFLPPKNADSKQHKLLHVNQPLTQ